MTAKKISKELKALIVLKQLTCETTAQANEAVNQSRREINAKYGDGWRNTYDDSKRGSSWITRGKKR